MLQTDIAGAVRLRMKPMDMYCILHVVLLRKSLESLEKPTFRLLVDVLLVPGLENFLVRSSAEDIRGKIVVITKNKLIKRYQPGDFKSIFRVLRG